VIYKPIDSNLLQPYKTINLPKTQFVYFNEKNDIVISNEDKNELYKYKRYGRKTIFIKDPYSFSHKDPFKNTDKDNIYSYKDITMYYNKSESKIEIQYKDKKIKIFYPKTLSKKKDLNLISSVSNNVYVFKFKPKELTRQFCYQYYIVGEDINKEFEYCHKKDIDKKTEYNNPGYSGVLFAPHLIKYKLGYIVVDEEYEHSTMAGINSGVFLLNENFELTKSLSVDSLNYYGQIFDVSKNGCELLINSDKYFKIFRICN
jgi:hypothetical protein